MGIRDVGIKDVAEILEEYDRLADFLTTNFQDEISGYRNYDAIELATLLLEDYQKLLAESRT